MAEDCIFCADVCRVTLDLQATHSRAHTAPQTASGAVQACIWLHLRVCLTSVRPALHLMTMLHRRDGVGDSDAAAAFMSSFARPCKICSWGLAELIDRAARAVWCSHPSCTLHEMGRSGALHACGGDHPMAVGGLAGPSRNLKPSIPVPAWPVLTSTVPGPPPLAKRPLAAVARAYESTWCLLLNNHVYLKFVVPVRPAGLRPDHRPPATSLAGRRRWARPVGGIGAPRGYWFSWPRGDPHGRRCRYMMFGARPGGTLGSSF
jgi:hypothetical protein